MSHARIPLLDLRLTPEELARFRVQIPDGLGCREWTGERNNKGYGRFTVYRGNRRIRVLAHRLALALKLGHEPLGTRHTCDNPPCCHDDHLLEGTQLDNLRDAARRGRIGGAVLPGPRPRGEQHSHAKLTEGAVLEARARYAAGGVTLKQLALDYGVKPEGLSSAIRGISWGWLK